MCSKLNRHAHINVAEMIAL